MDSRVEGLSQKQRNIARAIALLVIFVVLAAIPFGVMYGRLGKGSVLVTNILSCLLLANIGLAAVCWISMRTSSLVRK